MRRCLKGIDIDSAINQAANLARTKMQLDYEASLPPQEREALRKERNKQGIIIGVLFVGVATVGVIVYSTNKSKQTT